MHVASSFCNFVLDQLSDIRELRPRAMFGGIGLYSGETFFAILADDVLYLKGDDRTRGAYEHAGCRPFQPFEDRPMTMSYWSVPLSVLEDAEQLHAWAKRAIDVATSATKPRRTRKRRKR